MPERRGSPPPETSPAGRAWWLTLVCRDKVGIVAAVASAVAAIDGFILDSQQYADLETEQFFMRLVFRRGGPKFPADDQALRQAVAHVARHFDMAWELVSSDARPRMLIAVSKSSHCLNDLLHRWRTGFLQVEIIGVISNHPDLEHLARWYDVPFHFLPVSGEHRPAQEAAILDFYRRERADLLVLARYMQVLSPDLVDAVEGRCINIHHSFLPSFKGSMPYERAHGRGVKLIGATAHFVTRDLDEGPIIEQAVERVDHRATATDLARIGRDIEARVLARAVGWVAEKRVLLNGNRTVVFS